MLNSKTFSGAGIALCLVCVAIVLCAACGPKTVHDINLANKGFSDALNQLQASTSQAEAENLIDHADAAQIYTLVSEAVDDHKTLTQQLRTLPPKLDNVGVAIGYVQTFANSITGKQLHLKSARANEIYSIFLQGFNTSVALLLDTINTLAKPAPLKAGLDANFLSEILIAWGGINALIGKLRANGDLTDQQLQDAADVEDDETKKAALLALKG